MCYDKARQNVRISWNAEVIPKTIFGGQKSTLYVDGISVYEFSKASGNITQHRIERLVINDTPIAPEDEFEVTVGKLGPPRDNAATIEDFDRPTARPVYYDSVDPEDRATILTAVWGVPCAHLRVEVVRSGSEYRAMRDGAGLGLQA